jgi:hypothetical protein
MIYTKINGRTKKCKYTHIVLFLENHQEVFTRAVLNDKNNLVTSEEILSTLNIYDSSYKFD